MWVNSPIGLMLVDDKKMLIVLHVSSWSSNGGHRCRGQSGEMDVCMFETKSGKSIEVIV